MNRTRRKWPGRRWLHHIRKQHNSKKDADLTIDDLYGSTWITSGAGSVVLLTGKPGDPIVKLRQLKQPAAEVGPFSILHNDITGRSETWHAVDLVELVRARGSITALDAAKALYDTEKPTNADREKARRKLTALVNSDHLWVLDPGDDKTNRDLGREMTPHAPSRGTFGADPSRPRHDPHAGPLKRPSRTPSRPSRARTPHVPPSLYREGNVSNVVRSRSTIKTVLKGDPEHRNVKARLSDDPHPDPPVDGAWTIHAEDGVVVVPEKLLAWEAARQAAHQKAASDERR